MCVCVRACVRACVREENGVCVCACVRACVHEENGVSGGGFLRQVSNVLLYSHYYQYFP